MASYAEALHVLENTSRTFYLPIIRLPQGLQEAVAAAYLCMRAIDEVEDHPTLDSASKVRLLAGISRAMQAQTTLEDFSFQELDALFKDFQHILPEVTLRIGEWACQAPAFIAPRVWEATAAMANRMAQWVLNNWRVLTQADLDRYTYGVAGSVGLMLCDLWGWFEKVQIHRGSAIQFGRGLQAVNILRNRAEDLARGVDFFPQGWDMAAMFSYARANLDRFSAYLNGLPMTSFHQFVRIPQALAYATLDALERGEEKLTRDAVVSIVSKVEEGNAAV